MALGDRLQHAWNAFRGRETVMPPLADFGTGYYYSPSRNVFRYGTERSIVASIYNRIAIDVAAISIHHVRTDDNGRYLSTIDSGLENCLNLAANKDQTGRAFVQDIVQSLCDEGVVAIVPVDTSLDPTHSGSYQIDTMRVGKIMQWFPDHVQVQLYNDRLGDKQEVYLPKDVVAIVENPLYAVMNEPNSTLQRLIRKLNILDVIDEQSGSGKLDLIIQLPYVAHTPQKRAQAEQRRKDIEMQLTGSKYGIAYTDGTERITQLNRPAENNLMSQIEYLTNMLYSQLGMTEAVFNGTASEAEMLNYYNRTTEPIVSAIVDSMKRTFLTKTARSQHQTIMFFRDPFRLVPVGSLAEVADKLTRNEILSPNEFRAIIGYKPVNDPRADELRNRNLNQNTGEGAPDPVTTRDELDNEYSSIKVKELME